MQLLISVAGPAEARAALRGGADVIDAKDPRRGALGPVSPQRLAAIRAAVAGARPLSAAVGDATSEQAVAGAVAAAHSVGVAFVKLGLAGVTSEARADRLAVAARRAVETAVVTRLVLVAYADWRSAASLRPACCSIPRPSVRPCSQSSPPLGWPPGLRPRTPRDCSPRSPVASPARTSRARALSAPMSWACGARRASGDGRAGYRALAWRPC